MRMRKKKNLEPRLAAVADYFLPAKAENPDYSAATAGKELYDFSAIFQNDHPVVMEIGCGKGQFICELAKRNPDINYIAVEKIGNVVVVAAEQAKAAGLSNVKFMQCGAEYLPYWIPEHSVSGIILNFSCPYPKNSHITHRLTHPRFLKIYQSMLLPGAEIHQKTDNMHFFEYSIETLTGAGFRLKNVSLDLHHSNFEGNIVTEYESRFLAEGKPIYRLEAYLPPEDKEEMK